MNYAQHFKRFQALQAYCKEHNKNIYLEFANRIAKYGPSGLPSESVSRYFTGKTIGTAVADPGLTRIAVLDSYTENAAEYLQLAWDGEGWQRAGYAAQKEAVLWLTGAAPEKQAA